MIFHFWFFSSISFPPALEYPIRTVSNFFENSPIYSQLKVDHRCLWHRWQMRKILNQINLNNFAGTPLDSRVNTYLHFCLQVHFKVSEQNIWRFVTVWAVYASNLLPHAQHTLAKNPYLHDFATACSVCASNFLPYAQCVLVKCYCMRSIQ